MPDSKHKLVIVIPTIGRPAELGRMLESLAAQTRLPDQIIIIDQDGTTQQFTSQFPQLPIRVIPLPGSACLKRNAGFRATQSDVDLIAFMDDDIVLEPQVIEAILRFWENAPENLGGVSCNLINHPKLYARKLKSLRLVSRLGLYDRAKGVVSRSGFQTMVPDIDEDIYVQWLPSGAACFSRHVLEEFSFDEWFENYSYVEDVDLSYRVGKKYRLAIVADAPYYHYPSPTARPNPYLFGKKEVLNRLYFVSKHPELSRSACYLALSIRAAMSVYLGLRNLDPGSFKRVAGNFAGLASLVCGSQKSSRRRAAASIRQANGKSVY